MGAGFGHTYELFNGDSTAAVDIAPIPGATLDWSDLNMVERLDEDGNNILDEDGEPVIEYDEDLMEDRDYAEQIDALFANGVDIEVKSPELLAQYEPNHVMVFNVDIKMETTYNGDGYCAVPELDEDSVRQTIDSNIQFVAERVFKANKATMYNPLIDIDYFSFSLRETTREEIIRRLTLTGEYRDAYESGVYSFSAPPKTEEEIQEYADEVEAKQEVYIEFAEAMYDLSEDEDFIESVCSKIEEQIDHKIIEIAREHGYYTRYRVPGYLSTSYTS